MQKKEEIITDPFGSYTGLVKNPQETPVQDAEIFERKKFQTEYFRLEPFLWQREDEAFFGKNLRDLFFYRNRFLEEQSVHLLRIYDLTD